VKKARKNKKSAAAVFMHTRI